MSDAESKRPDTNKVFTFCDGNFRAWIDQDAIHIKAVDEHGDPIELSAEETRVIISEMIKLVDEIQSQEEKGGHDAYRQLSEE